MRRRVADGTISVDVIAQGVILSWQDGRDEEEILWFYDPVMPSAAPIVNITHDGQLKKRTLAHLPQYAGVIRQMNPEAAQALDICIGGGGICGAELSESRYGRMPRESFSRNYQSPGF